MSFWGHHTCLLRMPSLIIDSIHAFFELIAVALSKFFCVKTSDLSSCTIHQRREKSYRGSRGIQYQLRKNERNLEPHTSEHGGTARAHLQITIELLQAAAAVFYTSSTP